MRTPTGVPGVHVPWNACADAAGAGPCERRPMRRLTTVVILLVVLWLAVSVLGALVKGLLWLTALGLVALAATVGYAWWKARDRTPA